MPVTSKFVIDGEYVVETSTVSATSTENIALLLSKSCKLLSLNVGAVSPMKWRVSIDGNQVDTVLTRWSESKVWQPPISMYGMIVEVSAQNLSKVDSVAHTTLYYRSLP